MKKMFFAALMVAMFITSMLFLTGCGSEPIDCQLSTPTNIRQEERSGHDPSQRFVVAWDAVDYADHYRVFVGNDDFDGIPTEAPYITVQQILQRHGAGAVIAPAYALRIEARSTLRPTWRNSEQASFAFTVEGRQLAAPLIREINGHMPLALIVAEVPFQPVPNLFDATLSVSSDPFSGNAIEIQINDDLPSRAYLNSQGNINLEFANVPGTHKIRVRNLQITQAMQTFVQSEWSEAFTFVINDGFNAPTNVEIVGDDLLWSAQTRSFHKVLQGRNATETLYSLSLAQGYAEQDLLTGRLIFRNVVQRINDMLDFGHLPITTTVNGETVQAIRIFMVAGSTNNEKGFFPRSTESAPIYFIVK